MTRWGMNAAWKAEVLRDGLSEQEWQDLSWALIRMVQAYSEPPIDAPADVLTRLRELNLKLPVIADMVAFAKSKQ